jgi:hypothetical protein
MEMAKFIKLHKWIAYRNPAVPTLHSHGAPVWVAIGMITQMSQYEGVVSAVDGPKLHQDKPREIYTSLSFPAGMQEETDGVYVIETPEEILKLIDAA